MEFSMTVPFPAFGPGIIIGTRTDLATPVAINVGYAQELSIDFNATGKELYGQNQFPLAYARGTIKATGKFKAAVISGIALNALILGQTLTPATGYAWNIQESHAIPTTPFQVTVTNAATFDADLGVTYAASGLPLQRVSSVTAAGQYSVNTATGVYTFYTSDSGSTVLITYTNTVTTATIQSTTITNQLIGTTPTWQLDYYNNYGNNPFALRLFQCVSNKLSFAFKLEDFMMPEVDFGFFANNAGKVFEAVYPQIS
jgi:hypothetical protein